MGPHGGIPSQETRGGNRPDWAHLAPGEPLAELPEDYPEPDSEELPSGLGTWDDDDGNTYGYGPDGYSDPDGEDGQ
jgi:hypothetical protein